MKHYNLIDQLSQIDSTPVISVQCKMVEPSRKYMDVVH